MSTSRFFDDRYVERAALKDGTQVTLRLVTPEDKEILRTGFERLSLASRYARFHAPKTKLSADELRYLTECDQADHFAIGAVREPQGDERESVGLGVARFIRDRDDARLAEAAIAVADEAQGKGLGRLLFLRLCAAAAERGIERFQCDVLGGNHGMKALLDAISPERHVEIASGVMSIEVVLPNVTPTQPPGATPEGAMYRLFRAVAERALQWTRR